MSCDAHEINKIAYASMLKIKINECLMMRHRQQEISSRTTRNELKCSFTCIYPWKWF